jgi:hypothetical protein
MVLLDLIDAHLFGPDDEFIEMTPTEIRSALTAEGSACRFDAQKLLQHANTCGRYLSRLLGLSPRVAGARTAERRAYRIARRANDG